MDESGAFIDKQQPVTRRNGFDSHWNFVRRCLPGIVLASAAYQAFLFACGFLVVFLLGRRSVAEVLVGIWMLPIFISFGAIYGLTLAAVLGSASLSISWVFNSTFGKPLSEKTCGICAGSLACYVSTVWVFFLDLNWHDEIVSAIFWFVGAVLAMVVGSASVHWHETSRRLAVEEPESAKRYQIDIRHLLLMTAWMAVLFLIANRMGGFKLIGIIVFWMVSQSVILLVPRGLALTEEAKP